MATALYRLIKYGFQTFWRQKLLTVATLVVIVLALLLFQGLILTGVFLSAALTSIEDKIDISVFFTNNTPEDEVLRVKREVEELEEVKEVEYISKEAALEIFQATHQDDEDFAQAIELLGFNPLSPSLNIRAENPEEYPVIQAYVESIVSPDVIEKITFKDPRTRDAIENLSLIIRVSRQVGVLTAIFLTTVAILVSFNTIFLGIYSNRDEISIMRLVGASNLYVRGPFIVIGILYGVIAAVLSMAITAPIILLSSDVAGLFVPGLSLSNYFTTNFIQLLLYNLAFGVGIGVISSFIAIRRYLKV